MQQKRIICLVLALAMLAVVPACKKKGMKAGSVSPKEMLKVLPDNPLMVFSVNAQQFSNLPFYEDMVKEIEKKSKEKNLPFTYQDFIQRSGIDPKKDVYFFMLGLYKGKTSDEPEGAGVINLRYQPLKLLQILREEKVELLEEKYGNLSLYAIKNTQDSPDSKGKDFRFCFFDTSNILLGTSQKLKQTIDLFQGKGSGAFKNVKLNRCLSLFDPNSLFWMVFPEIPEEAKKKASGSGMMQFDLSKAEAFFAVFNHEKQVLSGEMRLLSKDEKGNKSVADMLNGLKGLAAMGAAKEGPEVQQLLSGIMVSSTAEDIRLTISISDEVMKKLAEKAKKKAENLVQPASPTEPPSADETQPTESQEPM